VLIFLPALLLSVFGSIGFEGISFGDSDFVGVFDNGVFTQGKENDTPYPMNRIGDYVCFH